MNSPAHPSKIPLSGSLLLSSPSIKDGVFDDSVILLHNHGKTGAEGLILNKPLGKTVGDFMCSNQFEALKHLPLYSGGPVAEDQLSFASFYWSKTGEFGCRPAISADEAIASLSKSGSMIRAYLGSSSWTKGQLEDEIENFCWFTTPAFPDVLGLPQDQTLWKNIMQRLSPFHHIISLTPKNPSLN